MGLKKLLKPQSFVPRREFPPHNVVLANFVGHHRKALADLRQLSGQVDYILELRDSRVPLSSINPLFNQILPGVPKLTLYTKKDISKIKMSDVLPLHPDGMFQLVDDNERKYARRVVEQIKQYVSNQSPQPPLGTRVLIAGMPNAGKSSLINKMRQLVFGKRAKKVTKVGSNPGITRALSEQILINNEPRIYVIDSPGVFVPRVDDWEQMLKLCLVGAVSRKLVDPVVLADYLLFKMNLWYPLGGRYPGRQSNDIHEVLWNLARTRNRTPKRETWNENAEASAWVDRFTRGGIGKLVLDDMSHDKVMDAVSKQRSQDYDINDLTANVPTRRQPFRL